MPLADEPAVPHWTSAGTLLLPIARAAWPPPAHGLRLDGVDFAPKGELHVTVVGRALGGELAIAMAADRHLRARIDASCRELCWAWRRGHAWWWLERRHDGGRRRAIVERIELPAMADFHAALGTWLRRTLPVPPPHVTLFTAGDANGIGVPDPQAWDQCVVRAVAAAELAGLVD